MFDFQYKLVFHLHSHSCNFNICVDIVFHRLLGSKLISAKCSKECNKNVANCIFVNNSDVMIKALRVLIFLAEGLESA